MSRFGRVAAGDHTLAGRGTVRAPTGDMRNVLVAATLLAFGCGQLRYASRTEMVEVAPDPAAAAPQTQATSAAHRRASHWQGLLVGGTVASLLGVGLIVGGAVGWKRQEAANAEQDAQCMAAQGWLCGAFDDLSYMPYGALLGVGSVVTLGGVVMLGFAANGHERESR